MDWLDLRAVQGTLRTPPKPQFKSIDSLALSFLYSPTLTSIHDDWKSVSLPQISVPGERVRHEAELCVGMIHVTVCVHVYDSHHVLGECV